jgi:hypothetical protein
VPIITDAHRKRVGLGFTGNLDLIVAVRMLYTVRTRFCDGEFHVLDILDGKIQPVRDGGDGKTRNRDPFCLARNA